MPGYKKKGDKEHKAARRREKREKREEMGEYTDDYDQLNQQLSTLGLALRQIPGDGNCLFRALCDQIEGSSHNHFKHRENVVQYMVEHREDFEPFVEDDISFDQHLRNLSEPGTFGGNDSIVAFARLHNLTVVIHQVDKPLWQIHGGRDGTPGFQEAHVSYHNGDHYNSVRRSGDTSCVGSAGIRLVSLKEILQKPGNLHRASSSYMTDSGEESDYENSPSSSKLDQLIQEVSRLTGNKEQEEEIIQALERSAYSVQSAVDYILEERSRNRNKNRNKNRNANSIWSEHGTGSRIIGTQVGEVYKPPVNKNMSSKRQKELKKREQRLLKDTQGKGPSLDQQTDQILTNIKTLTI
ncbi:OTU domain-containing protein 3 [Eurytemora carolleeae]|uniref:OTU domain-containing protein 3 n=1 Tax=Eurytemora carolleeae TaxID=1294199 RepID=UPI000C7599EE|nr:OTU domain-containing protein 3 [Eurytemora carolleeae]|eukprot:XP_023334471.1 OTU domain-containing protein 3-like [Eurytemora affinis]